MTEEDRETLAILLDGVLDKYRDTVILALDLIRNPQTPNYLQNMKNANQLILGARRERDENIGNALNVVLGWEMDDRISRICCNLIRGYFGWTSHDIQTIIDEMERVKAAAEAQDTKEQDIIREDA